MPVGRVTKKPALPAKAVPKKTARATSRAPAAPDNRTSAMLKDIRAKGKELTADIADLLQRLS